MSEPNADGPSTASPRWPASPRSRFPECPATPPLPEPLRALCSEFGGSLRAVATIAEHLGLAPIGACRCPVQGLSDEQRTRVAAVVDELGLGE